MILYLLLFTVGVAQSKIYFYEDFNDDTWENRWIHSTEWKSESEMGTWELAPGNDWDNEDMGIKVRNQPLGYATVEKSRFYGLSAKLDEPFTNEGKDLILQYSLKFEDRMDCGGAYLKLLGPQIDQVSFGGETPYQVMFGPDICGSTRKVHVIFNYPPKGENIMIKGGDIRCETDKMAHLYRLHVLPDNTFKVLIDGVVKKEGRLEDNFDFLPAKEIDDPAVKKPDDWVDEEMMPDPDDVKPEGWDDLPKRIPDPDATKPDTWDDEEDGVWEPPLIRNPEYKGPWKPRMIKNPDYKGKWVHPKIANPDYAEDDMLHSRCKECTHIGFELWQVKAGSIFDKILVTDDLQAADEYANEFLQEKKKKNAEDEEKKRDEVDFVDDSMVSEDFASFEDAFDTDQLDIGDVEMGLKDDDIMPLDEMADAFHEEL